MHEHPPTTTVSAAPKHEPIKTSNEDRTATDCRTLIGSISEWYERHGLPLLDLRSLEAFKQHHIEGSVHIPLHEVRQRSYELPPRQIAFAVLVPCEEEEEKTAVQLVRDFFLCQEDATKKRAQKPWNIPLIILARDKDNWRQAKELNVLVEHNNDKNAPASMLLPLPRLWQPDPMVRDVLLPLVKQKLMSLQSNEDKATSSEPSTCYEIWDLGAGAGRDVCFLAEELKATICKQNFCVFGMDQRYRDPISEECVRFWKRRHVESVTRYVPVQWKNANGITLEHHRWFQEEILKRSNSNVFCIFAVRFWNRSLFEYVANADSDIIGRGALVAVSQFAKPYNGAPWDFEHPKEKNVLEREELSNLFSRKWSILHDIIVEDSDHGRTLVQFVAQRRC